jgi:hypothetical protein
MAESDLDTAALRPATGLDDGARMLIVQVAGSVKGPVELSGDPATFIVRTYFRDRYGGFDDYLRAVQSVWGDEEATDLSVAVSTAGGSGHFESVPWEATQAGVLLRGMPEPDFRRAIEETVRHLERRDQAAERITAICRSRGIPWVLDPQAGFEWVGDETIEREVMQPALTILNDPRFASGVAVEFNKARDELKEGTPEARKQVLTEASNSVESAMKVVLDENRIAYDPRDAAQNLFEHLYNNGLADRTMDPLVLAVPRARNKRGGHGAGAVAHDISEVDAETYLSGAAAAIVFLGKLLPAA